MKPISSMFNEVQYELVKIILLNVFLSTVILFLILDLIALIFNMPLWYVIVVSFIYFLVLLIQGVRSIQISKVEEKNPELKEILRTAHDNLGQDNLMAHALFSEVLDKMRKVSSGTFIDFKTLMVKLTAVFVLAILLISIAYFNVDIGKFDNPLERPLSAIGRFFGGGNADGSGNVQDAAADVFGDYKMADLGDNALVATVNPSLDSPDFSQVDPSSPSADPLADLGTQGDAGFNSGEGYTQEGLDQRDLQRSYKYAKETQG